MRLVACPNCHTQYDVAEVLVDAFPCRCGATLKNEPLAAVEARVHRCSSCGAQVAGEAERCDYCGAEIVRDPDELSLICPECYARNADASRFCTGCGVAFRPERVRVEGHELPCPVCTALMPPSQVGGVALNECRTCHGLWVAGDHFDLLVSRAAEARRSADPVARQALRPRVTGANPASQRVHYRKCPECDGYMQRRNYRRSSGVIVDVCRNHGTWLDADELEQIAGFILSGGETSRMLEAEHHRSSEDAAAAAALARLRMARDSGIGSRRSRDEGGFAGGLVDLLTDIFS